MLLRSSAVEMLGLDVPLTMRVLRRMQKRPDRSARVSARLSFSPTPLFVSRCCSSAHLNDALVKRKKRQKPKAVFL